MVTQLDCAMLEDACKTGLKNTYQFTFENDAARDALFSASPNMLENADGRQTLAFIGTDNLKHAYWNGPDKPGVYDAGNWVEVANTVTPSDPDITYWGSPDSELSMRARRDQSNGYLIFERRVSGSWVEKFKISDSATVDSMKFIESQTMPVVVEGELGLYGAIVRDSERNNQIELRPVFMDHEHNHFMVVAALPNGRLRVPQNVDAALNDPDNVPVTYKYCILQGDAAKIRDELKSLTGDTRLPASAIDGLPASVKDTAEEIRDKLKSLLGSARLPASAIAGLPTGSMSGPEIVAALELLQGTERLDASAIKNLPSDGSMTGAQIITAIENDPTNPRLPAGYISYLTGTEYIETDSTINFDPVNKTYMELAFQSTGPFTQTMPNLVNTRDAARLMLRNYKSDESVITLVPANSGQTVDGKQSYTLDAGVSALFIAMKDQDSWHLESIFEHDAPTVTGITIDDGRESVGGVNEIHVRGAKVQSVSNNVANLLCGPDIGIKYDDQHAIDKVNRIDLLFPLEVTQGQSAPGQTVEGLVEIGIKPDAYESMHKPSFLAYLDENEEVLGRMQSSSSPTTKEHHDATLWFDDVVWPAGTYVELNRNDKKFGIQDADGLDPNVSGGTDYLIAFRIHMKGVAPDNGVVRAYLYNASVDPFEPTGFLLDKNGNPMVFQKVYHKDQELGFVEVVGIVNAKGLQEFTCHVMHNFTSDTVTLTDRTEGVTGLLIQALASDAKSGVGLLQFESDTSQNIQFSSHYLGVDRMNLAFFKSRTEPDTSYAAGVNFISSDGWRLINPNGIKIGVTPDYVHILDDGVNICDFNFGKIFDSEETQLLRGKDIEVTVTLTDKESAFRVALMSWAGTPNGYTPEIFTTRNNGSPVLQKGWVQSSSFFISEDAVEGEHTLKHTFIVPEAANNYGIIIYPVDASSPTELKLNELKVDVSPAFTGYFIEASELGSEEPLYYSTEYKEFVVNRQGNLAIRYTLNNVAEGLPMPCGVPFKGAAHIELDETVNKVTDTKGEGALKFKTDGASSISVDFFLWNEQSTDSVATFWWATVDDTGQVFTKIPESEVSFTVKPASNPKHGTMYTMPEFSVQVEDGTRLALRGKADRTDGAYLRCDNNAFPLIETTVKFKELVALPSTGLDLSAFTKKLVKRDPVVYEFKNQNKIDLSVTIPEGTVAVVLGMHSKDSSGVIRPIKNADYKYENGVFSFSFPQAVDGQIIMEFLS